MMRKDNCSLKGAEIPLSSEFFQAIKQQLWLFLIPVALILILLAVFLEEMGFFFRNSHSSKRRRLYLWILGIYPVFGLSSLIGMFVPRSTSLCNFIASLYHSITLWKFLGLVTDFFGGKVRMLQKLKGEQVSPNPFPCCCCCCLPLIAINRTSVRWMTAAVFQLSVVRTVLFFVILVLWTDEQYDYGDVGYKNPNVYVNALIGVSTLLSFYGYLLFYKATRRALSGYGLRGKFVCIVLILFLCGLQSGILETIGAFKVVPCTPPFSRLMRSQLIYHYSVTVEMFCIGLFARQCFRKIEPDPERGEQPTGLQKDAGVQTEEEVEPGGRGLEISEEPWAGATNTGYHSDSEDSLCRIEHAPLDKFDFSPYPQLASRAPRSPCEVVQEGRSPGNSSGSPDVRLETVLVKAQINYSSTNEVTVV
ncbi:organic solute transporter subunit alpha [Polyodon spathula]|uniref:organic solute transporter subunit alpha n=1 Tax=Polyodon spathula TaxID=7913 RepID=UPI001B7DF2FD|nr:organic solute transporter subunit alpha [Polyodon spathula]